MAKQTVLGLVIDRMDKIERKLDYIIPVLEGLKVKAAIAGGMAGLVATGLIGMLATWFK